MLEHAGLHVGDLGLAEQVVYDEEAGLLAHRLQPQGRQQEAGLEAGGQAALGLGGGAAVGHSLATTQGVEVVKVES